MCNSGSSANLLMIAALVYSGRLKRGDRVAVPAIAWSTTYAPLAQFGLVPVIVDIDDSLCIDPNLIPRDVKAIFAVNLLGNPCDFDRLPKGPILIEDNCEAMGAEYGGKRTGSFGLMGSQSMFFSHHICTMEGGIVTTDDDGLYNLLLSLRSHGWTREQPGWRDEFDKRFEFIVPGFNLRPTEVAAAIGLAQMEKLDDLILQRRLNAIEYIPSGGIQRQNGWPSWHGFAFAHEPRDELLPAIEAMVDVRPVASGNIARHPMFEWLNAEYDGAPYADYIHACGFFVANNHLPMGSLLPRLALLERAA